MESTLIEKNTVFGSPKQVSETTCQSVVFLNHAQLGVQSTPFKRYHASRQRSLIKTKANGDSACDWDQRPFAHPTFFVLMRLFWVLDACLSPHKQLTKHDWAFLQRIADIEDLRLLQWYPCFSKRYERHQGESARTRHNQCVKRRLR